MSGGLTDVAEIGVGHWTHDGGNTGCTVILAPPEGCVASGSILGAAPASRESALLAPEKSVGIVHAVVLSGGSAYGLAAAHGVMRWLEEQGRGLATPGGLVPIVPAACLYDLTVAGAATRPGEDAGYAAAQAAGPNGAARGRVGAGAGATAGKYLGFGRAVRTGLGSASSRVRGATVAALAIPNPALGDVWSLAGDRVVAGHGLPMEEIAGRAAGFDRRENTTLVVVATDARLTKTQCASLSVSAHAGIARVTRPSHTPYDGDSVFVLSTGRGPEVGVDTLSVIVQDVVAHAVVDAAESGARSAGAS